MNTAVEDRVNTITGFLNAQHAALVDEVIVLLADPREWQGPGVWKIESYLHWRCGVSTSTAKQLTDIARRADDLPICITAFRAGELTLDQMTAIARRAPWWTDRQIGNLAKMMTVTQITRNLGDYPFPQLDDDGREIRTPQPDPDAEAKAKAKAKNPAPADEPAPEPEQPGSKRSNEPPAVEEYCTYNFGDDGVFRLHLATDFETGSTITNAIDEARDHLFRAGQTDVDTIDAVREIANRSLDTIDTPTRRSRFKTNLHINTTGTAGTTTDASGWVLPDSIRDHLTCDGLLSPVFVANGVPISVGRTQRIVPERTRTAIEHRDRKMCCVPGCTNTHGLEVHHIIHWTNGGPTDTWNLVLICAHHHRQHHRGLIGIAGNADAAHDAADALVYTDRNGRRIQPSGASPTAPTGPPPQPASEYEHPLGERLQRDCLYFAPPPAHQEELNQRITADRAVFSSHPDLRRH